jgi:glycosyltransferase involved in cell wall biosynthesis
VGASSEIVGAHGEVVPRENSTALAAAISRILQLSPSERKSLGLSGRARIVSRYSIKAVVERYDNVYQELLGFRSMVDNFEDARRQKKVSDI